jgi:uncharacterized BrkB/YihY/UPF0761 family membrane protein
VNRCIGGPTTIDDVSVPPPSEPQDKPGRIERTRQRVDALRTEVVRRSDELQQRVPVARDAFAAYEHDRRVGGEIMAGAIAFRTFIFLLPYTLVVVATLGIVADWSDESAEEVTDELGVGGIAAKSVVESARLDSGGRWIALGLGLFALYFASVALARSMRIAHALAWQETVAPMRKAWRGALVLVGTVTALLGIFAVVSRIRERSPGIGVGSLLAMVFAFAAAWLGLSILLPHRTAPWTALLPGVAVFAIGVEVLHVSSVLYFSPKISSSSKLYGPIGAAIGILLWAYFFGRLTVASAVFNATMWQRHHESEPREEPPPESDANSSPPVG